MVTISSTRHRYCVFLHWPLCSPLHLISSSCKVCRKCLFKFAWIEEFVCSLLLYFIFNQVVFNLWGINHDPNEWDAPDTFNPHRWLDAEGKCVEGRERAYLPFGAGRRVCLGEQMAKHELFLFVTRLIKTFRILPNNETGFPEFNKGTAGLVFAPLKYTAVFVPRDEA